MKFIRYGLVAATLALGACSLVRPAPQPPAEPLCPEPPPCEACEAPLCPAPEVIEKVVEVPAPLPPMATTAGKMHLPIVGGVEWVKVAALRDTILNI